MIYTSEERTTAIVYSGRVANRLLEQGYKVVKVMPDKRNKIKSVFVFQVDDGFEDCLLAICEEDDGVF